MQSITLQSAWNFCTDHLKLTNTEAIDSVYRYIETQYTSPERKYHNSDHLINMINMINEMMHIYRTENDNESKTILYLATFFHDIIYDTHPDPNAEYSIEQLSANVSTHLMMKMGIDRVHILESVYSLILLSREHILDESSYTDKILQEIFLDADMSILGSEYYTYDEYKNGIRAEYSHIDRERYISSRMDFLQQFTHKKAIFYTEYMNQLYRESVLENVNAELKELDTEYAELLIHELT